MALGASLQYALAFWLGLVLGIWAAATGHPAFHFLWPVPVIIYAAQFLSGLLRRGMVFLALPEHKGELNRAIWLDILASPLVNLFMLFCIVASALTKTIAWRGIRYRLRSANRTEVITDDS